MTDPLARLAMALSDRYRIEREIGAGGMATVYLAEDRKHPPESRREGPPAPYPVTPIVFIVVMAGFLISAIRFQPVDTLIGVALAATGVPVYFRLRRRDHAR